MAIHLDPIKPTSLLIKLRVVFLQIVPEKSVMAKTKDTRAVGRKGGFKSFGTNLPQHAYKGKGIWCFGDG